MSVAMKTDAFVKVFPRLGLVGQNIVAGGGADGVEQGPSAVIDRYSLPTPAGVGTSLGPGGGLADGAKDHSLGVMLTFDGNLGNGETLTLTLRVQMAIDLAFTVPVVLEQRATRPALVGIAPSVIIPAPAGGGAVVGSLVGRYDTTGAMRFLRAFYTATFSAGAVDEADVNFDLDFAGSDENPFRADGDF